MGNKVRHSLTKYCIFSKSIFNSSIALYEVSKGVFCFTQQFFVWLLNLKALELTFLEYDLCNTSETWRKYNLMMLALKEVTYGNCHPAEFFTSYLLQCFLSILQTEMPHMVSALIFIYALGTHFEIANRCLIVHREGIPWLRMSRHSKANVGM